jgi:hypothetical protein
MKPLITCLLILSIIAMLAGTALADATAPHNMPCCPGPAHSPERCHQFCASSPADGSAVVPRVSSELRAATPAGETQPALVSAPSVTPSPATQSLPSGKLFKLIHVFLV